MYVYFFKRLHLNCLKITQLNFDVKPKCEFVNAWFPMNKTVSPELHGHVYLERCLYLRPIASLRIV